MSSLNSCILHSPRIRSLTCPLHASAHFVLAHTYRYCAGRHSTSLSLLSFYLNASLATLICILHPPLHCGIYYPWVVNNDPFVKFLLVNRNLL